MFKCYASRLLTPLPTLPLSSPTPAEMAFMSIQLPCTQHQQETALPITAWPRYWAGYAEPRPMPLGKQCTQIPPQTPYTFHPEPQGPLKSQ